MIINVVPSSADRLSWFAGDADKLKQMVTARFGDRSPQFHLIVQLEQKGELGHIPGSLYLTSHAGGEVADRFGLLEQVGVVAGTVPGFP